MAVGDVWQRGSLVDHVSVRRRYMKRKTECRTVPLHPEAKAALAAWLAERPGASLREPLFPTQQGCALKRIQAYLIPEKAYAANNLTGQLGPHAMRKTFAHRMYARLGYDVVKTQKALGHKHITSTTSYLDVDADEIEAAILAD